MNKAFGNSFRTKREKQSWGGTHNRKPGDPRKIWRHRYLRRTNREAMRLSIKGGQERNA